MGLDVDVISAAEARRLLPAISPEALYGAVYLPGDGYLDPHGATHGLAAAARARGVRIRTNTRVTGWDAVGRGSTLANGRRRRRPDVRTSNAFRRLLIRTLRIFTTAPQIAALE